MSPVRGRGAVSVRDGRNCGGHTLEKYGSWVNGDEGECAGEEWSGKLWSVDNSGGEIGGGKGSRSSRGRSQDWTHKKVGLGVGGARILVKKGSKYRPKRERGS